MRKDAPQGKPEEGAIIAALERAPKVEEGRKAICKVAEWVACQIDAQTGLGGRDAWQEGGMGVKHDEEFARDEGREVRQVVHGVPAQPKPACRQSIQYDVNIHRVFAECPPMIERSTSHGAKPIAADKG